MGLATADAPADNSNLCPGRTGADLHGTTGVSTAGVLALLPGTEHVVHDAPGGRVPVGVLALLVVPDVDGDLPQFVRLRSLFLDAAPADHSPGLAGIVLVPFSQADGPHVGKVGGDRGLEADDGHVLVLQHSQ